MRKPIVLHKGFAVLALAALPFAGKAGNGDTDRKKEILKTYDVSPGDLLSIENSFGSVVVATWSQPQIQVRVEISTSASTDKGADQLLEQIDVKEERRSGSIFFKTDVGNLGNSKKVRSIAGADPRFSINYTVTMPKVNPLSIENSFGKTVVPDLDGLAEITSKFGSLTAGRLADVKRVQVEFGEATVEAVHNGEVVVKFSKSSIGEASGDVQVKTEFASKVRLGLGNDLSKFSLYESYSDIAVSVPRDFSAEVTVHTSFGAFRNHTDFAISQADDDAPGPRFDKDYSGQSGDGRVKVKMKSSFGKISLSYVGASDDDGKPDDDKDGKKDENGNDDDKDGDKKTETSGRWYPGPALAQLVQPVFHFAGISACRIRAAVGKIVP